MFRRTSCFVLLALVALLGLAPSPASAHASLVSSEPASGATISTLPRVVLRFDGPVEAAGSHVLITDGLESQTLEGVRHGDTDRVLEVDVPQILDGTYTVVWHVLARDGDPRTGQLSFSLTAPAVAASPGVAPPAPPAPVEPVPPSATTHEHTTSGVPAASTRLVVDLALAVLLGGLVFVVVVWPVGAADRRVHRILAGAAGVAAIGSVALAVLQHLNADSGTWSDLLRYRFGRIALARVVLLTGMAVVLVALRRGGEATTASVLWRAGSTVLSLGLLETIVLLGHSGEPAGVDGITRLVHAIGLSVWLGGLVLLLGVVLPRRRTEELRAVLPRFSTLATSAVALLVLAGADQVDGEGDAAALGGTTYGRILVLKVVVVAILLATASRSRAHVRRRIGTAGSNVLAAWVGVELGLIVLVFALTALLVSNTPPS
jgi:copper transport protein